MSKETLANVDALISEYRAMIQSQGANLGVVDFCAGLAVEQALMYAIQRNQERMLAAARRAVDDPGASFEG